MSNKRIVYVSDKQITATKIDSADNYLWIAFAQNASGNCILEKQSAFDPNQTFFSVDRSVDAINAMDLDSDDIYVAYDDSTLFGERLGKNNPITDVTTISYPAGANEAPIDVRINDSFIWFLTPGTASGENAKLFKYTTTPSLSETIDLTKSGSIVTDAISFDFDSNGDIWIAMNTDPAQYVRVFALSGGGYDFTIYTV